MAEFVVEFFNKYDWKRVAVLSSNFGLWMDAGKAFRKVFTEKNITVAYDSDFNRYPPDAYFIKQLEKIQKEARSECQNTFVYHYLNSLRL